MSFRLGDLLGDKISRLKINNDNVIGLVIDDCILLRKPFSRHKKLLRNKYNLPVYIVEGITDYSKGTPIYERDVEQASVQENAKAK